MHIAPEAIINYTVLAAGVFSHISRIGMEHSLMQ